MRFLTTLSCGFLLGLLAALALGARAGAPTAQALPGAWAQLLEQVRRRIHADYVDPVDDRVLEEQSLRGMTAALDAHSGWLDAGDYAALTRRVAGASGRPAVRSRWLAPGIGWLRIAYFDHRTAAEVRSALATFGTGLKGLALDLRGNPGGVLTAATDVADDFLDAGLIVRGVGRRPADSFSIEATPGDLLRGAPLVVLVDGGTASAAEILAGALKDQGRARLVGRRTWGKGTVQTIFPLERGALRLTTARYFTPAGNSIDGKGIMPDISGASAPPAAAQPAARSTADGDIELALRTLQQAVAAAASRPPAP